ncbi:hypothetical protein AVEN_220965-1 [Araneus ventricosus]|uniref:Uncharacterized protein n=1 Tax=Araneus ventricosus TaxID=182803 RepID=A0A4Y2KT79_ARAVE|nr:hypothetical protein AVEN_220965-1 [Araneus ventricosus]
MEVHRKEEIISKSNKEWLEGSIYFILPGNSEFVSSGRPPKSFQEACARSKKRRTQKLKTEVPTEQRTYSAQMNLKAENKIPVGKPEGKDSEEGKISEEEDVINEEDIINEEDDISEEEDVINEEDDISEEDIINEEDDISEEEDIINEEDDISDEEDIISEEDDIGEEEKSQE